MPVALVSKAAPVLSPPPPLSPPLDGGGDDGDDPWRCGAETPDRLLLESPVDPAYAGSGGPRIRTPAAADDDPPPRENF